MDRTNWKFGKVNINYLVLGVAYKGMAIPLFWDLLDKKGNSKHSITSSVSSKLPFREQRVFYIFDFCPHFRKI
jgi:hypothetical protein